ncbi:MAG: hypothetical protein RH948_07010 [Cyclobacteriaceae bacterium]
MPAILMVFCGSLSFSFFPEWLAFYLAFISVYELGYLLNDQMANHREGERRRAKIFNRLEIIVFAAIRIATFLLMTNLTKSGTSQWWLWYSVLLAVFLIHNVLKQNGLKVITFSYLAFARFFSPIIILVDMTNVNLLGPIFVHYVVFRLITYMDSKNLINFNRQTNFFRVIFHLLGGVFSICLTVFTNSYLPLWISAYYIFISAGFALLDTYFLHSVIKR